MNDAQVKSITPKAAYELLEKDPRSLLIDVRSSMEFLFVGHPVGAISIPWIDEPDWVIDPHFVAKIRQLILGGASIDDKHHSPDIILICRSGNRSLEAGLVLVESGLSNIYNIDEGFEGPLDEHHHRSTLSGWRFHGLPWEQC